MALKECIRNRALAAINPDKAAHIPYRNSKLTLILKDSFELETFRKCRTMIIANVSPSVSDVGMTKNTLRFIVPIKVGGEIKRDPSKFKPNPKNPMTWDNKMLREWIHDNFPNIDLDLFVPFETGMQLMSLPQQVIIQRLLDQKVSKLRAVWLVDNLGHQVSAARTEQNKKMMKVKKMTDDEENAIKDEKYGKFDP